MFRWHTYRILIYSALIWCILCVCFLLYYMDCLFNNSISCRKVSLFKSYSNSVNDKYNSLEFKHQESEVYDIHKFKLMFSNTYNPRELISWTPVVENASNPSHWVGERGKGVNIGPEELDLKNELFEINKFNLLASDRIALNRFLQDVRIEGCRNKTYPKLLPTTSIIIVFHNEAWSTLLRTVQSIIDRSPLTLIKEIILVDDASERGKQLEDYVSKLPVPVKLLRTGKRSGLIRARLIGAKEAKGQVITFLDAHCECTKGWLEPLLSRIVEDRTRIACPIIDVINDDTFQYTAASDMTWGGFNWKLNFRWFRIPQREMKRRGNDRTIPIRSPTMAGGLFSIDKQYFELLGKYDEGMKIWGGENLEMSFRVWMCGGTLEIVTCSHVGHVFRKQTPYTFPGGTSNIVNHNNGRLADVWLDEWKDFYHTMNPSVLETDLGDTSSRKQLRQDLQCKSFRWYLENIYPESQMPINYYALGDIMNVKTKRCLDTLRRKNGEKVGMGKCHGRGGNQLFAYTKRLQIVTDDNCLDATRIGRPVKLVRCHGLGGNQMWQYNYKFQTLVHVPSKLCLDKPNPVKDPILPILRHCNGRKSQKWVIRNNYEWQLIQN